TGLAAQGLPSPPPAADSLAPSYRGFMVGAGYRDFAARARAVQAFAAQPMVCRTSRRTAQLMECGVIIRDPVDGVQLRLTAHFVDGRTGFVAFGDSGDAALVERVQREVRAVFGPPTHEAHGTWEWRAASGRRFARFNWRGQGAARWAYVTLTDLDVLDRVARYVTPAPAP
ncbi:MAG TPA: hypothetical protein VFX28_02035, partial [Methylomirabilota bacterium]|nr:hypothetical protein [Methylomirabilota bacterium]